MEKKMLIKANGKGNLFVGAFNVNEEEIAISIQQTNKNYGVGNIVNIHPKDESVEVIKECIISFVNPKSVEVVIEKLLECKAYLKANEILNSSETKNIKEMNKDREKRTTKHQKVAEHLEKYGSITSLDAIHLYNATRLSAIIFNLRKKGWNIETVSTPFVDCYGTKNNYGKYILHLQQ